MATYYVDSSGTWAAAQTGADNTGNEWQGPAGLQEAFDTVAANDTVIVKGDCDLGRLITLTVNDTTGWAIDDAVQNDNLAGGVPGDDWTGVIYEVTDGTHCIIELATGKTSDDVNISDGIDNVTQADQETISAKALDGIQADGTDGSAGNLITFTGVNGSWVNDGTLVILDGSSGTAKSTNCIYVDGTDYYYFENFRITDASGDGFDTNSSATQNYWIIVNCDFDNCGAAGADMENLDYSLVIACRFHSNTGDGMDVPGIAAKFIWCSFYNNTLDGWSNGPDDYQVMYGCIVHNNSGTYGAYFDAFPFIANNVFDDNDTNLRIASGVGGSLLLCNRITNGGTYGFNGSGPHPFGWNLFHNNTTDTVGGNIVPVAYKGDTDTNEYDPDADDGYNDRANDDFNLKDSRTYTGETEFIDLGVGT